MRIGILGTGNVGKAVAVGAAAAGHDVVLGSRDPDSRKDLGFTVVTQEQAAAHGEIVVNALGSGASLDTLPGLGAALDGKILLDIAIDLTPEMDLIHLDRSLAEQLQAALPDVRLVKTFCTVDSAIMAHPLKTLPAPTTIFLSGEDPAAKATVGALLTDFGWAPEQQLDLGGIASARAQEHMALMFVAVAGAVGGHVFNFSLVTPRAS
ncbi:NAD(P)-binding domain-containing protein [Streptomyces sp. TRM66268-LWL]|uniref:NAD(P)-binding domain-containing protein n=1 Tax=Streptomyces polyasparticus TaxID=2767826 RepID=A0ABR7SF77_9ACTN|nr:NAD(P)-binding domain-containing protein [Streptomyces polyasparticus]